MGFFSKLKQNFTHGGVKIDIQAPPSASVQDSQIPITLTLTSTAQVQINKVYAELYAETHEHTINIGGNNNDAAPPPPQLIARVDDTEQFVLTPNQAKSIQLHMAINVATAIEEQMPEEGRGIAQLAQVMQQQLHTVSDVLNNATYYIQAKADVEGVMLDPSARRPIELARSGQQQGPLLPSN